ncbi:3-polyprenyl-4-hydroxybenzoate decarboxylase and related decarboxylases, VdcC [Desulfamplus magnetovallimortis]|uniref:3-polyprenyl-4-hydroxybenzoate decarboxylase and related decarboxylases, VdcC n=1 Tax=Desulfamplus magnetovallimortis TaxID=1246637 RepID=A0A1W1H4J7_9BACT|nr:UbiD family decarboxylase [Desulfamplus magnetovallimortis]SLM27400.1 3-polyprenyl-4-hydroxybenzoate decarboxylase and related decarboxylases, VdcC [Desulfamplus magnetovallimortis]
MKFDGLRSCIEFLEKEGELVRIEKELDPDLEMAEVHNRVFEAGGPAVFFENVKGSPFPAVSNLFGTYERALKILEPQLGKVADLVNMKSNLGYALKSPIKSLKALFNASHALPFRQKSGHVLYGRCHIHDLPMIRCWPRDGGGFIYLPQVFSNDVSCRRGISRIMSSNLGMYRIQLSGNDYIMDREVGVHYQIHRGIGNHHTNALKHNLPLPVTIFVGGPPAHTLAAVMPLPEGMPEVLFAGALAGRSFRYTLMGDAIISLDADFCITGRIFPGRTKPEGPFGDHLGYYSLVHDFPYFEVDAVYHRKDAIWPFTVVGRPPREDSVFGRIIHEITATAIPDTIPGVTAIHAVDAAGVHPLLFAKAMERYVPFERKKPRELLTHANAILGTGQLSLAKYLIIASHNDSPALDVHDEMGFMVHSLERIDFRTDLHFQTCTTMDTLDYSSEELNGGSKLVMVSAGDKRRELLRYLPSSVSMAISEPFSHPKLAAPGILVIQCTPFKSYKEAEDEISALALRLGYSDSNKYHLSKSSGKYSESASAIPNCESGELSINGKLCLDSKMEGLPLIVIVDNSVETVEDFPTFLWVTFSRSNPSHDIYGVGSFTRFKHWGCTGSLIIDARVKPFHAPELVQDMDVVRRVDMLGKRGGPLYGII